MNNRFIRALAISCAIANSCWSPRTSMAQDPILPPAPTGFTLTLPATSVIPEADLGSVQFIGNATVLLRYRGLTILTDPNFLHKGEDVHLGYGLHSERLTNPAIEIGALPPIDLVILSHLHEDHFDKIVQNRLARDTPIVTTRESSEKLRRLGFTRRYPLSRWETLDVVKGDDIARITAMPGRHGPPVGAILLPTVMGTMVDFSSKDGHTYRIYISGDTLVYDDIAEIPQRYPNVDLALLHLGGTRILGVMKVTMDGKDGVRMMQIIAPKRTIPIHFNDYDVFKSPLDDFRREVDRAGLTGQVIYLPPGESYRLGE